MSARVTVIGGGLAGCEAALQLARRGVRVRLLEMRPGRRSPAHETDGLAELVCSNSFRGDALSNAVGLLKEEMRRAGGALIAVAAECSVPAGGALAVDRALFSSAVERRVAEEPLIEVHRGEATSLPGPDSGPVIVATGPLTSGALAAALVAETGGEPLWFYDAIAPIVDAESIDRTVVFAQSRYGKGDGDDYLNCPMSEAQYRAFVGAVRGAELVPARAFEEPRFFEACLPIETMAGRGDDVLAFGPMKPVGLVDPRTGERPFAVVQLRQENRAATAYNLVGFQTRMTWGAQREVLRTIPGLERAEFLRMGSVHRNTFVDSPRLLGARLELRTAPHVRLAGQITGVEGYVESMAVGFLAGLLLASEVLGVPATAPPPETALGALLAHLRGEFGGGRFQPSNVNWAMFPPLPGRVPKQLRPVLQAERALASIGEWTGRLDAAGIGRPGFRSREVDVAIAEAKRPRRRDRG